MSDERYQKIMADLGMPHSRSLLQALQQVANEVTQETRAAERERCAIQLERLGQHELAQCLRTYKA